MQSLKHSVFFTLVLAAALVPLGCGDTGGDGGSGGHSEAKQLEVSEPGSDMAFSYRSLIGSLDNPEAVRSDGGFDVRAEPSGGPWTSVRLPTRSFGKTFSFEFEGGIPAEPGTYETTFAEIETESNVGYTYVSGAAMDSGNDPVGEPLTFVVEEVVDGELVRGEVFGKLTYGVESGEEEIEQMSNPLLFRAVIVNE